MILDPANTTLGDLCTAAMEECGRLGIGQTAQAEDLNKAWARCQWMLQEWERKRWLVYHLVTYSLTATGQTSYTFGPGGEINTNVLAAWTFTGAGPLEGYEGSGYAVYDQIVLTPTPASGSSTQDLTVEVTEVSSGAIVSVAAAGHARGYIQFGANPSPGQTITLNGVLWTFVASGATGNQTTILGSGELTIAQLVVDLTASSDEDVAEAVYTTTGTIALTTLKLNVFFAETGTAGDDFILAASFATPSGANLTLGFAADTDFPGPLPNTFSQASTTGSGLGAILGFPSWSLSSSTIPITRGSVRPAKLESAFLRQINVAAPNQIDYPMDILQSMEDYNRIALKQLSSFPGAAFLDSAWPLGNLYFHPVPASAIYSVNVTVREQLPTSFLTAATPVNLPFEYYSAIHLNLALRLRSTFSIPSFPGDPLPGLARNALATVRGPNTQIARLSMPTELIRPGIYNIFSDRNY